MHERALILHVTLAFAQRRALSPYHVVKLKFCAIQVPSELDFVHFWKRQISVANRGHGLASLEKDMCRLSSYWVRQFFNIGQHCKQRLMLENPWPGRTPENAR